VSAVARVLLGVDVGGSSIKAGLVDVDAGVLQGELVQAATPQPAAPAAVMETITHLASRLSATRCAGVAFPSIIKDGRARTAAHIDQSWIGVDGALLAARALGCPAVFLNDADAAGLAEMRWGAGRGLEGVVIMLTFGTGIGTALFSQGKLFPNTELGRMELRGVEAEEFASARIRTRLGLTWAEWIVRVNVYLEKMQILFWPDAFILGGAVSERFAEFAPHLRSPVQIRPAQFAGQAGVMGAALAAAA
jgi:polyphosphate glucokinase